MDVAAMFTHKKWYSSTSQLLEGILKRFEDLQEMPMKELRRIIELRPPLFRELTPTKFEQLLADVYRDYFDCEVHHIGGPGDNGVDAFAIIGDQSFIIQAKRRSRIGHIEGVSAVRELIGTAIISGASRAHLVTTAEKFSQQARRVAAHPSLREYNIEIEFKAYRDIYDMLCLANNDVGSVWEQVDHVKRFAQDASTYTMFRVDGKDWNAANTGSGETEQFVRNWDRNE